MTIKTTMLSTLFDEKTIAILYLLLKKKDIFYLRDLSRDSGVSLATTYRIIQKCHEINLVEKVQQDKLTFYKINRNSETFQEVYELLIGKPEDILENIKKSIFPVKLYFSRNDKSKLFIVGDNMDNQKITDIIQEHIQSLGINPKLLFLSQTQFGEMKSMGLLNNIS